MGSSTAAVAQLVEQRTENPCVAGSIPACGILYNMGKYLLERDGDPHEYFYASYILDHFPRYEVFWENFIVPWTNREFLPRTDPRWVQFKLNIPQFIEEICMAHYSVFRSLAFFVIERAKHEDERNEYLRSSYVHFGHAIEMAYLVAVKIQIAQRETLLISAPLFEKKKTAEMVNKFNEFLQNEYEGRFKDYELKQIPVMHTVHGTRHFLNELITDGKTRKILRDYFSSVQEYRNKFAHSPLPGTLFRIDPATGQRIKLAIKKGRLNRYSLWTDIIHSSTHKFDDFLPEDELLEQEFLELKKALNKLWEFYIKAMSQVLETNKLKEFLSQTKAP